MSGTGQPNFAAPSRLTPMAVDQPIGISADGLPVVPTPYFAQMLQRILSYLGQPAEGGAGGTGGSGGSGITLSEQVEIATALAESAAVGISPAIAGINSRVSAIEEAASRRTPLPPPPVRARRLWQIRTLLGTLAALADVRVRMPADGDGLTYDGALRRWHNLPGSRLWCPVVSLMERKPLNNEELFKIIMSFPTHLPAGLPDSQGGCDTAPTANAVFTLKKGITTIGTATILASATVATFAFAADVDFAETDTFSFFAPTTADATMQGVYFSFKGSR